MKGATRPTLLHLIDTGGPGGAETILLRLIAGLAGRGWGAIPVISRDDWLAARLREDGHDPVILNPKGSLNWRYLKDLLALLKRHNVAGIVTHLYGSAIYGGVAGRLSRKPVLSILHGQSDVAGGERLEWLKTRIVAHAPHRLIAVSEGLRTYLGANLPARPDRWKVITNGVDTDAVSPGQSMDLRRRLRLPEKAFLVGALGNIRRPKAYDDFLRVAAGLTTLDTRYHFVVAGQGHGALFDELLKLREALGVADRVHFIGAIDDIAAYLGDLDLFLLTSQTEGFSLACVEAMACGLPVVATRAGGPEGIVLDEVTGRLSPVGDIESLVDAINTLACDPVLRKTMGAAGRKQAVRAYSLQQMISSYELELNDMLGLRDTRCN